MKTISSKHIFSVLFYSALACLAQLSLAQIVPSEEGEMLIQSQEEASIKPQYKVVIPKELSKIGIYNGMPYNLARDAFQQKNWAFIQDEMLDYSEPEYPEIGCERTQNYRCLIIVQQNNKTFELFLNKGNTLYYLDGEHVPSGREKTTE